MATTAKSGARATTGEQAINAAMAVGFEITEHGPANGRYRHQLTHTDGRALVIDTELGTGRLLLAEGRNRAYWNATYLAARSTRAIRDLLAAGSKSPEQMPSARTERCQDELTEMHLAALDNERRLRNDLRREQRRFYGR